MASHQALVCRLPEKKSEMCYWLYRWKLKLGAWKRACINIGFTYIRGEELLKNYRRCCLYCYETRSGAFDVFSSKSLAICWNVLSEKADIFVCQNSLSFLFMTTAKARVLNSVCEGRASLFCVKDTSAFSCLFASCCAVYDYSLSLAITCIIVALSGAGAKPKMRGTKCSLKMTSTIFFLSLRATNQTTVLYTFPRFRVNWLGRKFSANVFPTMAAFWWMVSTQEGLTVSHVVEMPCSS